MPPPPPVDPGLWAIWCTSHVRIDLPGRRVQVTGGGATTPSPPGPDALWVLTAWNPLGVERSAGANRDAGRHLITALGAAGVPWHPAVGRAVDGSWEEEGVAARLPGRGPAQELGRRWEQLAVYEWTPSTAILSVVACYEERVTSLHAEVLDLPPLDQLSGPRRPGTAR